MKIFVPLIAIGFAALMSSLMSSHADDRVISTRSGAQVEFQIDGSGPAVLMIASLSTN
jgi:hypothetical protein